MKQNITRRDLWYAWVLPTIAALCVTAILIIERLQVDWTADCSLTGENACDLDMFRHLFAWLPASLTFALFHIWGARRLLDGVVTTRSLLMRGLGLFAYLAFNLLPFPGWYLWLAGAGGGIAISLTIIGVIVAPLVGVLTAGFCAGVILGVFAGPPFRSTSGRQWKTLLWAYGLGGGLGAVVLSLGQVLLDPAFANTFGVNMPWLTALGALGTVLLVGLVTSLVAHWGWVRAGLLPQANLQVSNGSLFRHSGPSLLMWPISIAVLLVLPVHFMVRQEMTIFPRDGAPIPALVAALRGHKPGLATTLSFAGLTYTGPRDLIVKRAFVQRQRVGSNAYDRVDQWELSDVALPHGEVVTLTADSSALRVTFECETGLRPPEEFCIMPEPIYRDHLRKTFAVADEEEAFLISALVPDAALGIRFDVRKDRGPDKRSWPLLYCRLNLTSVTSAKFSAMQIIPCDANWTLAATQLRARLESSFSANPAQ